MNKNLTCDGSIPCNVICEEGYSCFNANIKWPSNQPYSLQCTGDFSCAWVEYTPYTNSTINSITFQCTATNSCKDLTFHCPENTICNIDCITHSSCVDATFNCPDSSFCNATCWGSASCYNARFNGPGSISCTENNACREATFPIPPSNQSFNFNCDTTAECTDANIFCPTNADCLISCGAYACYNTTITLPTGAGINGPFVECRTDTACRDVKQILTS